MSIISKLVDRYAIEPSFFQRYFLHNAEAYFAVTQLEFMLWRRGRFVRPHEKAGLLEQFIIEEIENFYIAQEINLPHLQFAVTARCTLRCRDCNAMIPLFRQQNSSTPSLSFVDFRLHFDALMSTVNKIRRFILLGGEPLMNDELPNIVDYCARHIGIATVEIITNGTIMPSALLLDVCKTHAEKVYFHLSNYSSNQELRSRLKYNEIVEVLKINGLKHQMSMNLDWNREEELRLHAYTEAELQSMFNSCWLKRCVQVFDGKVSLCPRLSFGRALNMLNPPNGECIDLCEESVSLKQSLIEFYQKKVFESCRYCVRHDERIEPAIQQKI